MFTLLHAYIYFSFEPLSTASVKQFFLESMTWLIKQVRETSFSTVWRFKDPVAIYKEYITVADIM